MRVVAQRMKLAEERARARLELDNEAMDLQLRIMVRTLGRMVHSAKPVDFKMSVTHSLKDARSTDLNSIV